MLKFSPFRCPPGRKPTGAKLALKPVHVWGIRVRLQVACKSRDLALFDLALDSKLRGCDLVSLKVGDLMSAGGVKRRVMILQRKTGRPVQFEVTEQARRSIAHWIETKGLAADDLGGKRTFALAYGSVRFPTYPASLTHDSSLADRNKPSMIVMLRSVSSNDQDRTGSP